MSDHSTARTDMSIGLGLVFTAIALLGAIGMFGTGYLSTVVHVDGMQTLSAAALTLALAAGGLAIVSLHVYQ